MNSKLLKDNGLENILIDNRYNIRRETVGEDQLAKNVDKFLKDHQVQYEEIYSAFQVHGTNIEYCDGKNGEDYVYGRIFMETDGLITDKKGLALIIKFADCTPIIIYDKEQKIQCALHSGWRSTRSGILDKAINILKNDFGSKTEDLLFYLGPSIDQDNYQVGQDVYEEFKDFKTRDEFFRPLDGRYYMDIMGAHKEILKKNDIPMSNIEVSNLSTFEDERLFSAREAKGKNFGLNGILSII